MHKRTVRAVAFLFFLFPLGSAWLLPTGGLSAGDAGEFTRVIPAGERNAPTSFGDVLSFTLPESGLGLTVAHKAFTRPDPRRDPADALCPDVYVPTAVEDLRQGRDPHLERVKARAAADVRGGESPSEGAEAR